MARALGRSIRAWGAASWVALGGCGGGAPLLHPAHPLPAGRVTAAAGSSQRFALGEADEAMTRASTAGADGVAPSEDETLARGAVADVTAAPGIAPWLGVRAGLGGNAELGATAAGSLLRVDLRRAFVRESFALSIGGGIGSRLGARLGSVDDGRPIAGLDTRGVTSLALDVPILAGVRSSASVVSVWGGLRPGTEWLAGDVALRTDELELLETRLHARRIWLDGVLGAMVGIRPVWVAIELDVGYQQASGRWSLPEPAGMDAPAAGRAPQSTGRIDAVTVTPAAVLVGRFR